MNRSRVGTDGCLRETGRGRRRPAVTGRKGMQKAIELVLEAIFQSSLVIHVR